MTRQEFLNQMTKQEFITECLKFGYTAETAEYEFAQRSMEMAQVQTTQEMLREALESRNDNLTTEIIMGLDCQDCGTSEDDCDCGFSQFDALELTVIHSVVGGKLQLVGVELLLGFGGPNVSLVCRNGASMLKGTWGMDTDNIAAVHVDADQILEHYEELLNGMELGN